MLQIRSRLVKGGLATVLAAVAVVGSIGVIGCGKGAEDAKAANPGGGAAGGRAARTVVIAPTDVAVAQTAPISNGIAITGTLRPIETVDVRARIDGDVTGVYVREGEHVSKGQLLAQFEAVAEQSSAASAQAGSAAARADLSQAQWNLKQTTDLYHAGAVSEADFRTAQQQVNGATARLAAASATQSAASITARDTRVTAPISGIIAAKTVDVGEHLARAASMFTLVRNLTLELAATVPERQSSLIKVGQRVMFSVEGQDRVGRVARVSPTIDPASRSITVYVDVENADGSIKGNSLATGTVLVTTVSGALVIPTAALHQGTDSAGSYVYRINTGAVEQANVAVGIVDNRSGKSQITSGLNPGDKVVSGNVGTLSAGAKVQVIGGDRSKAGSR
ncbi:MAG: efflux RND transporter periplasmic adaptor subunit [Gemmatimonadaceae bacterium]